MAHVEDKVAPRRRARRARTRRHEVVVEEEEEEEEEEEAGEEEGAEEAEERRDSSHGESPTMHRGRSPAGCSAALVPRLFPPAHVYVCASCASIRVGVRKRARANGRGIERPIARGYSRLPDLYTATDSRAPARRRVPPLFNRVADERVRCLRACVCV